MDQQQPSEQIQSATPTTPQLLDFQIEPTKKLIEAFKSDPNNRGYILVQPAGTGKTYELAHALKAAQDKGYLSTPPPLAPCQILILTTAKVATAQFPRVLLQIGVKNFHVVSHAALSSTTGEGFLNWTNEIVDGCLDYIPSWDEDFKPSLIIVDESQKLMNKNALISKIIIAAVKQGIKVVLASATPYTRLSETFVTCVALKLCDATTHSHRNFCANFGDYIDWNASAMERFDQYISDRGLKISAENIKFAHRVFNKCRLIQFESERHREIYEAAYEEYLEECRKNNKKTPEGVRAIWVAMIKFRKTAENLRSGQLTKVAIEVCTGQDKQVIIASNFTSTLEIVENMLVEVHGINPRRIAKIIGGLNCQEDIDAFQEGDKDYCLLSLKSGGAGLSLHHDRKNGKARPRYCILPPTWSAIELVQVLGRAHRITSISATYQDVIWYEGTIEEKVSARVARKMKSLKKAVTKKEVWTDLFEGAEDREDEELDELKKSVIADEEEKDEDGISIIDSLPLEAFEDKD